MRRLHSRILVLATLTLFSSNYWTSAQAKELIVATSLSIPPYIIKDSNSGIQLEIVREALKINGHIIKEMKYASNLRVLHLLLSGRVNAVINLTSNITHVFYSDTVIEYENVAIALKKNNFKINKVADLEDKHVLAFQSAHNFLTPEFTNMAQTNKNYKEIIHQVAQVHHLYLGRAEVVVMGKRIFKYYQNQVKGKGKLDMSEPVIYYNIFPLTPRRMGFRDEKIRDDFNSGLKKLKTSGKYQQLIDKYLKK